MNKRRLSQASLLRLPICFFPGREKAKWFRLRICFFPTREKAKWFRLPICFFPGREKAKRPDFQFAFSRPGKKQNGSDFQFAFFQAGKKQSGSDFQFAFSRPGKKQNVSDLQFGIRPGNKQHLWDWSPRPSAYERDALSFRPQLSEKHAYRLYKRKLDVQFAFPAQTSNLLFPGSYDRVVCALTAVEPCYDCICSWSVQRVLPARRVGWGGGWPCRLSRPQCEPFAILAQFPTTKNFPRVGKKQLEMEMY